MATAIGRLGCYFAGCCYGKIKNNKHFVEYTDPKQNINEFNNVYKCNASTSILLEISLQFLIAGLCLQYPEYANQIYGLGSIVLIIGTKYWRQEKRFDDNRARG